MNLYNQPLQYSFVFIIFCTPFSMILPQRYLTSFSPFDTHIILASKAKLFDPNFTSSSFLYVYDYKSKKYLCEYKAPTRYNTIGYINENTIVGGMEDGTFEIYVVSKKECDSNSVDNNSVDSKTDDTLSIKCVYSNNSLLQGDILSFSYNSSKQMLALSSENKKFLLFNVNLLKAFSSGLCINEDLISLSWNLKVTHILAGLNKKNEILVFDLKQKREVFKITKEIGKCKKIWWSEEKSTFLYIFGEKGLFIYDLSCDKISRVCEGGISIRFGCSDTANSACNTLDSNAFLVCTENAVVYKSVKFSIEPIFDAQFKKDFVCLSFFDKTEIIKIEDLFKKNGFLFEKKNHLITFLGNKVITFYGKFNTYKLAKKNYEAVFEESSFLSEDLKNLFYNKNIFEFFMQFYKKKGENENDAGEELWELIKSDCENSVGSLSLPNTSLELVKVPYSVFLNLHKKSFTFEEFDLISDKSIVFILSKFTDNFEYLINKINLNDFYFLILFLRENKKYLKEFEKKLMQKNKKKEANFINLMLKDLKRFYKVQIEIIGEVNLKNYVKKMKMFEKLLKFIKELENDFDFENETYKEYCKWASIEEKKKDTVVTRSTTGPVTHATTAPVTHSTTGPVTHSTTPRVTLRPTSQPQSNAQIPPFIPNNTPASSVNLIRKPKFTQGPPLGNINQSVESLNIKQKKTYGMKNTENNLQTHMQNNKQPISQNTFHAQRHTHPIIPNAPSVAPNTPSVAPYTPSFAPSAPSVAPNTYNATPHTPSVAPSAPNLIPAPIAPRPSFAARPSVAVRPSVAAIPTPQPTAVQPPATPNLQPHSTPHQQTISTPAHNTLSETDKQFILENLISKIKFLQETCKSKNGVLLKNKINTANKRLEYFKNEMSDDLMKDLEMCFNLININEIKNGDLNKIKEKIYESFKEICEDIARKYESEAGVWLPGVVGLLQVCLSDK